MADTAPKPTTADIRAWARTAGLIVGTRGRLPRDVIEAYERAHS